jgi:hypothetical protein
MVAMAGLAPMSSARGGARHDVEWCAMAAASKEVANGEQHEEPSSGVRGSVHKL